MLALYVVNGLEQGRVFLLDSRRKKKCVIGRSVEADVPLADDGVSRRHAELVFEKDGWVLKDLDSRNGTFLNALPAKGRRIVARDVITVGPIQMLVAEREASGQLIPDPDGPPVPGIAPNRSTATRTSLPATHSFLGASPAIREVIRAVEALAETDALVLIRGETGTGKDLVARALHASSKRRAGPFVAVNCGAIPENLVESELFGHEAGAFTGAAALRRGYFEEASGGTLFLDEVGDLPPAEQPKLLRVLEARSVRRIGATEEIRVDVRVLAATHRDLEKAVAAGTFREDLYHRLKVAEIVVPPLREHPEDITDLVMYFLTEIAVGIGRHAIGISDEALAVLGRYPWPGNVRELKNALERAVILARGPNISAGDLAFLSHGAATSAPSEAPEEGGRFPSLKESEEANEKKHIEKALLLAKGNKTKAAQLLGIGRQTLYEKLRQHGLGSATEG